MALDSRPAIGLLRFANLAPAGPLAGAFHRMSGRALSKRRPCFWLGWLIGRSSPLARWLVPGPSITAFGQYPLRSLLCFKTRQRAAGVAAGNFPEDEAKALPIIKARCHVTSGP